MERITEPELMNDIEQAEAYAKADFEEPHDNMIKKFKEIFSDFDGQGFALDLGCGPADISIRMAKAYPNLIIHGVDGSEAMLKFGYENIEKEDLKERVFLFKAIIPDINLPRTNYEFIFSNSLLHHLHKPEVLWQTIKKFGQKSTKVFIMDTFRPKSKEEAKEIVSKYSGNEPEILRRDFYNSLLAGFSVEEVENQLREANLNKCLKVEQFSDRHLIVYGILE